jgi:hypothetical protein
MRPASRRALLKRLEDAAPRGARVGTALGAVALVTAIVAWFATRQDPPPPAVSLAPPNAPVLDPVLALPFGQGTNGAAPVATMVVTRVEELRAAFRRADDRAALYREWRERPEIDARYLAFRAARDCERLRQSGASVELETMVERKGERERQIAAAIARCSTLMSQPVPLEELQQLERETADGGHPAAQVAYVSDTFGQRPLAETLGLVKKALASGDPLAFDEARVVLAMSRHQVEIGGAAPTTADDLRTNDERVVAIDIASCRLGNPCGPARGAAPLDCGDSLICQRDAEAWLMLAAGLDDDERRTAVATAERLLSAFKRGAVDEIARLPTTARQ